jgi:hypothetical protein
MIVAKVIKKGQGTRDKGHGITPMFYLSVVTNCFRDKFL